MLMISKSTKFGSMFNHGPINHVLATPFISYRVTRKTQDLFEISSFWQ